MNEEFTEMLLAWVIQTKNIDAFKYLKRNYFLDPIHKEIFDFLKNHFNLYGTIPSLRILLTHNQDNEDWKEVVSSMTLLKEEEQYVADEFNTYVKETEFKQVLQKYAEDIKGGKDIYDKLFKEVEKITSINIGKTDLDGDFIEDSEIDLTKVEPHPTFLENLNSMTALGGFYSPQLIIILGGPKAFKTGLMINLAIEYAYDGLKVYYADFENGREEMKLRLQQSIVGATDDELELSEIRKDFRKQKRIIKQAGGGIYMRSFRGKVDTIADMEKEIDILIRKYKFVPDVIFIDYLDIVGKSDPHMHIKREIIQDNYIRAVSLNKKYDTFSFSVSKVTREAFDKEIFDLADIAEDAEKLYNAHAVFAYMQNDDIGRIAPLVQRKGKSRGKDDCWFRIDPERGLIEEIEPGLW